MTHILILKKSKMYSLFFNNVQSNVYFLYLTLFNPEMKSEKVSFYSSDFNRNVLIYSTKEGNIYLNHNYTISTTGPNHVKFYPPDVYVFTTTGINGLAVYDSETSQCLYRYRKEELSDHCYSPEYLLSSYDQNNIKFYDLRQRYMNHNIPCFNIDKIDWIGKNILVHSDNTLKTIDFRNNQVISELKDIKDFIVSNNDTLFYITNDNILTNSSSGEVFSKPNSYIQIFPIKYRNKTGLVGLTGENMIKVETFDNIGEIPMEDACKEIKNIHFGKKNTFLFCDDNLFTIEKGYF